MDNSKKYRRRSRSKKSGRRKSRRRSRSKSKYKSSKTPTYKKQTDKEQKPIRNQFNMIQIKKLIGKKLLIPWKWITITDKMKKQSQEVQKRLISLAKDKNYKTIVMTATSINGVFIVIKGIERYMAINSTSYKTIKNNNMQHFKITLVCYPKLTQSKIKEMIS